MKVKFNSVDEFISELRKDSHLLDRRIVRLTVKRTLSKNTPGLYYYSLVGTAKIQDDVIVLEDFCGGVRYSISTGEVLSGEGHKKAEEKLDDVEKRLLEMEFDVRPGIIEDK